MKKQQAYQIGQGHEGDGNSGKSPDDGSIREGGYEETNHVYDMIINYIPGTEKKGDGPVAVIRP